MKITLHRKFSQRRDQTPAINFIKDRAISGTRSKWSITETKISEPLHSDGHYNYTCELTFEKTSGSKKLSTVQREWASIVDIVRKSGNAQRFLAYPWLLTHADQVNESEFESGTETEYAQVEDASKEGVQHALADNVGVSLQEVKERALPLITELLENEDSLNESAFFRGIFGRNAQIRCVLSSVKSFLETDGERRHHSVLFGSSSCGKSLILKSVTQLLGSDACLSLDSTSLSKAGLYKIFFEELKDIPEPPIVILEEAEKTSEESLRVWLGALDDRSELRKINARQMTARKVKILCLATVNDKQMFDRIMGGSDKVQGAISSRFVNELYCPRPDRSVLEMILKRDIDTNGGDYKWVNPILDLAQKIGTDDPRRVLNFLSAGDRILTGEYQKDYLSIIKSQHQD